MSKWKALFGSYNQRAQEQERQAIREQQLAHWARETTEKVMALVGEVASVRAVECQSETGQRVEVASPSRPPINVGPDGPHMSFMTLRLGRSEVHMYSYRQPYAQPFIHFVQTGDRDQALSRRNRMQTRSGCRIDRREDDGFCLVALDEGTFEDGDALSVDELVYRAFELLLEAAEAPRRSVQALNM